MKVRFRSALCALGGLSLIALAAVAAEPPAATAPAAKITAAKMPAAKMAAGGPLDKVWTIIPKPGMEVQFEKAFAAHVQWRRDNKDPWSWEVYTEADGPEVGARFARSGNHTWADFDAYEDSDFAKKADEQWNTTVAPYVAATRSSMSEYLPAISHWPDDAPDYQLFQLNTYRLKPGAEARYLTATGAIAKALMDAKWPYNWGFLEYKTGPLPSLLLVIPALNWAGFKDPEPDVFAAVASVRGEATARMMFDAFSACVAHIDGIIVRRMPQYTVNAAK